VAACVRSQGEVLDPERCEEYQTKAAACIVAAAGKYIVRGGDVETPEGRHRPVGRPVVLEFRTRHATLDR
jgi:uncharacterized protein (DUF1330 family)